ncbi:ribosome small subunit-dependent GTPase A [Candidatus Fermentibacteria bacterium]|nr:ribosome small subunit-dependent GTPase A [Candidatus Fermentibacteria bacterium]
MQLSSLGWNDHFGSCFAPYRDQGFYPGRIAGQERNRYLVFGEFGAASGEVTGRFRFATNSVADFPVVGDWVAASVDGGDTAAIHAVLSRVTVFSRKAAGRVAEEQALAANVDTAFIVTGLDHEFNPRRIERYAVTAWDSGATPVLVLNKTDVCLDVEAAVHRASDAAPGVAVVPVSARDGSGLDSLAAYLSPGITVVLLGSSGVGKSSLVNRLAGTDMQAVAEVRQDDSRGRHTTTSRDLIVLPDGALLIDTPGLRELQLMADDEGVDAAFDDVARLADGCRFADCRHDHEPGCAVKRAVEAGEIHPSRLASYHKLQREARRTAQRMRLRESRLAKRQGRLPGQAHS